MSRSGFNTGKQDQLRTAIELSGWLDAQISIIPTAAVPGNNHQRAGQSGVRWFKRLGAAGIVTHANLVENNLYRAGIEFV